VIGDAPLVIQTDGDVFLGGGVLGGNTLTYGYLNAQQGIGLNNAPEATEQIDFGLRAVSTFPFTDYSDYELLLYQGASIANAFGYGVETGYLWANGMVGYKWYSDGTNLLMTVAQNGAEGDLTVTGDVTADAFVGALAGTNVTSAGPVTDGYVLTATGTGGAAWEVAAGGSSVWTNLTAGTGIGYTAAATNDEIALQLDTEEGTALTVDGDGDVTVGTRIRGNASLNSQGVVFSAASLTLNNGAVTPERIEIGSNSMIGNASSSASFDFFWKGQTDGNMLVADASANSVGIGTNAPASKLEVVGTVTATGYTAGSSAGISITNSWVDAATVTNTQIFTSGLLTSWTQTGP
jgi:hypothetical protein